MEPGLPDLRHLFFETAPKHVPNTYTKKTLLHSPVISAIYPYFKVSLSKPLTGLASTSINDENDQTIHAPEQDSYFGDEMSEDDDIMWDVDDKQEVKSPEKPQQEHITTTVQLVVKTTSMTLDGVEFGLNSGIRSSTLIPGGAAGDDSLLISIQSGYTLLIRVWRVPRAFGDASSESSPSSVPQTTTSHFYKPLVVQWWKTEAENLTEMSGWQLSAHVSGLAAVSASPSAVFRIHMCQNTDTGIQLLPQVNVPVNGVILHSCFSRPPQDVGDDHLMFLALTFTPLRRLDLLLYSWYLSDSLTDNLTKSTLPLNSSFPVPVMIVPLANNHSFLFVCTDMFIVVTVHNITSADYSFSRFAYDGSFPTSFFLPEHQILDVEPGRTDEVLLASDSGTIYSVLVSDNRQLTYTPIAQVADPVSVFTLHKNESGHRLIYASDTGGSKELQIASLFSKDIVLQNKKLPYSEAALIRDFKNWSPVVDILVIDTYRSRNIAPYCSQELWSLTGVGKRTKLTHLRTGYSIKKETKPVSSFRKTQEMFYLSIYGRHFILCSMPFATRLLEYQGLQEVSEGDPSVNDSLVEIESPAILVEDTTIYATVILNSSTIVQFTPTKIALTDLESAQVMELGERRILHVDVAQDLAALLIEEGQNVTLELIQFSPINFLDDTAIADGIKSIASISLNFEVSALSIGPESSGNVQIYVGGYDGRLNLIEYNQQAREFTEIAQVDLSEVSPYSSQEPFEQECIVPHDITYLPLTGNVFVGSKTGHLIQFKQTKENILTISQFLKLGFTHVNCQLSRSDPNFLLVSMRNLWLFNFYSSNLPMPVVFEEKTDRPALRLMELPSNLDQHLRFAFTREDGLVVGSLFCHKVPLVKQISIGESAKRICYLDTMSLFTILCKSKDILARLRFVDRKTNRVLPIVEVDAKLGNQRKTPIFENDEVPVCGFVWRIQRLYRVSKKLILGTSVDNAAGSVKILDIAKVVLEGSSMPIVKIVELITIPRDKPVTCIEQIGSTIFFSSGSKIYSTSYSFEDRKLRPVRTLATLSSEVISMSVSEEENLLVNTRQDSLIVFRYFQDKDDVSMVDQSEDTEDALHDSLSVSYKDPVARSLVNHAQIGTKLVSGDKLHSSLVIVDKERPTGDLFTYKLSMIPRIFISKFDGIWATEETERILGIGVNGEVIAYDPVSDKGDEISKLREILERKRGVMDHSEFDWLDERLNRPFADKVTGKGFQNIYKPFFDFAENKGKLIDYDLEDLSTANTSSIMI